MPRLRLAPLLAFGLALATTSVGPRAHADEVDGVDKEKTAEKEKAIDGPAPEPRFPPFTTRFKVLTTGILVAGAAWGISFGASRGWPEQTCVIGVTGAVTPGSLNTPNPIPCVSGPPGAAQLGIPIVGPWIALGKTGCPTDDPTCTLAGPIIRGIAYVIDGVVQLGGLALIAEALVMKTESSADPKKSSGLAIRFRGVEMRPVPLIAPGAQGFSISGTF